MEPTLTDTILRGLATIAARAEADSPEDILGDDETGRSEAALRETGEVEAAINWVRAVRRHRQRASRHPGAPAAAAADHPARR